MNKFLCDDAHSMNLGLEASRGEANASAARRNKFKFNIKEKRL